MANCYVCGRALDHENQTEEHIFLNAIGGHLMSKELICQKCNSDFGDNIDTSLAEQFNMISALLNIKRDRGIPQPFKAIDSQNDIGYIVKPGGKILLQKPDIKQDGNHYTIKVNDEKQAHQVLNGLKRKYPEIDVDAILQGCHLEKKYIDNPLTINFTLGGEDTFRSLCKTAINFYLYKGGNRKNIIHLIPYIQGKINELDIVSPFYLNRPPIPTKDEEILHSIIIRGDSVEKMLIAYIELFDFYKVIILLNGRYEDENIEYSYFYDVLSRKVVHREYELNILKYDVQSSLAHNTPYAETYKRVQPYLNTVIGKALNLQTKEHIRDLLDKARENFCRKTEGTNLTESDKRKLLVDETMNQLTPWILHALGEQNGNHFDH